MMRVLLMVDNGDGRVKCVQTPQWMSAADAQHVREMSEGSATPDSPHWIQRLDHAARWWLVEAASADALLTEVFAVWRSADGTRMTVSTPSWQMFKDGLPMDRLRAIHSALAAHRAATAPSEPTLESVASEVAFMWERDRAGFGVVVGPEGNSAKALLDKLAALARERRP